MSVSVNKPGTAVAALLAPERRPFVVGVAMLVLFAGAVVFGLNATHGMPLAERKTVKVAFEDLSGLNVGDDVRIASLRVGYVDALELEDGKAVAVLKIDDPDTELYENARAARVGDRSGLGQKFVDLDPGNPKTGPLRDGGTIPVGQTVKAEDINQLFDVFDAKTRKASSTSLRNLGGGMIGHESDLRSLTWKSPEILDDTGEVSRALATDSGAPLASMLASADRISARMAQRSGELAALTEQLGTTVEAFGVDGGAQVDASLARSPRTLETAQRALRKLDTPLRDTAVAMRRLRPGSRALGQATPDLRGLLREAVGPLQKVPPVNEDLVPAAASLTTLVEDARPLSQQLVKTGRAGAPFAGVLGAYSREFGIYYDYASEALSHRDSAGHWLRILVIPGAESIAGSPGPVARDPYQPPIGGSR